MRNKVLAYIGTFIIGVIFWGMLAVSCCGQTPRECVVQTFRTQLGVREATGHNDGAQVEAYLKTVHLKAGAPWCAAFVNWVLLQCGTPHAGSGWSPDWFPAHRIIWHHNGVVEGSSTSPQPGDVLGVYFEGKGRIAHVGFIEVWRGRSAQTVEGNTNAAGSREGIMVDRKIRLTAQLTVANWIDHE